MTLRLVTGFEELPSSGINEARMGASGYYWFSNGDAMPAAETGRFGYGSCLHASLSGFSIPQMNMVRLTGVDVSQGFMGFAYKWEPTTSGFTYVSFFDAVNSAPCFTVSFGAFGIIRVWRGYPGSTLLVASAPGAFTQSQWFYCEIGATVDGVGGAVEVRVNTQPVIALLSANTDGAGRGKTDAVSFGGGTTGFNQSYQFEIDDVYFNDAAGSLNNTFLGNVRVKSQFAASAGDSTQFSIGGSAAAPRPTGSRCSTPAG
jgi:hypothetical protein